MFESKLLMPILFIMTKFCVLNFCCLGNQQNCFTVNFSDLWCLDKIQIVIYIASYVPHSLFSTFQYILLYCLILIQK